MKIVFVLPRLGFGGAERVVSVLANEFIKMNNDVRIILTSGDDTCVYPLDSKIDVCITGKGLGVIKNWLSYRKLCKEYDADVVIAFMDTISIMACTFMCFSKIPVIASERNDPSAKSRKMSLLFRVLGWISKYFMAGYVFQSNGAKACYSKVAQKKSCIILNPFNTENLPEYDFENREKEIVTMGRLHPQKNHKLLIDAFAIIADEFKDYKLKIFGDGELKETLQKQIDELGLGGQVELMGAQKDILNKINKASLFVLSSDYEGLPNALIEAMCVGIPSVSTDCSPGGAREIIEDGENGFIVPCNDAQALAKAMKKVLSDNDLAHKFSIEAKKISKRMESKNIAREWLDFIECLK